MVYVPVYDPGLVYGVWDYPAFAPFYWYPPGYVAVGIFAFGAPCIVGAALWARYDWRARRVGVFVPHFNAFNRTRLANIAANQHWNHNPVHRGNIAYSKTSLQQRFGRPGINGNPVNNAALRNNLQNHQVTNRQGITGNVNPNTNLKPNVGVRQNTNLSHTNTNTNQIRSANTNVNVNRNVSVNRNVNVNVNRMST